MSLRNRTAGRRGRQIACVWRTWQGYNLRVLSWSWLTSMFSGLLQKDLFKRKWSLAKSYFKQNYCHVCHTRFAIFFPLPSCCVSSLISWQNETAKFYRENLSSKKTLILKVGAALIYGSLDHEISGFRNLVRAKSLQLKLTFLNVSFFIPIALFFKTNSEGEFVKIQRSRNLKISQKHGSPSKGLGTN